MKFTDLPPRDGTFPNEMIWNNFPEKAAEAALEAIETGGFGEDLIKRRVGNFEGQLRAIKKGWVDFVPYYEGSVSGRYLVNAAGVSALKEFGKNTPVFLPVLDSWHGSNAEYCAYEVKILKGKYETKDGDEPALKLFDSCIPKADYLAMKPLLRISDVIALRDYLNDYLNRTTGAEPIE